MRFRKVFVTPDGDDQSAGTVSGAVVVNVNTAGTGQRTRVSSTQRIVQRGGRTEIVESSVEFDDDDEADTD